MQWKPNYLKRGAGEPWALQMRANEPPTETLLIILPSAGRSGEDFTTGSE